MRPLQGLHDTFWETPNWCELEASIYDSRSVWSLVDLKGECSGEGSVHGAELLAEPRDTSQFSEIEEVNQHNDPRSFWNFGDLKDEYFGESSVQGGELLMEPSDTSQYSEIQEVSQQNGLLMTESYTEGNLWMSFNDQCINLMVRSSVNANDALVKDGTDEEDGALRMQPSMSNVQFKAHALKPNATNIMRQKRSNRGRTNQESVKFLVTDSTAKISDGYLWLKFGQKNIKNNLHPRSYFKCASSNCPVKKQVEKLSEIEGIVSITYFGKHNHLPPSFHALRTKRQRC